MIRRRQLFETFELFRDTFRFIGMRKVRHQCDVAHCGMRFQFFHHGRNLFRHKTQAVHAGIDLEPHLQGVATRVGIQHGKLLSAVNDAGQFVFGEQRQFVRLKETFQQQDGLAGARFAQSDGVTHVKHRETFRFNQGFCHAQQSMPVSVGFDDRHEAAGGMTPRHSQIVL